jgi:hypothetical protein
MSKPSNMELYNRVKEMANEKFDSPTGAYKSMWIVRKYKELGGKYNEPKPEHSKLTDWRAEHWVDLNQPKEDGGFYECGHKNTQNDKYPLCRETNGEE